ncbi:MAG: sensor domain-containing diguanylate cyclase [Sideroxyarcus sp.]|nr:sensor domain-containing diguanylate cyclase [Sideroxyarcus sp.]
MSHSGIKSDHGWFRQLFESSPDPTWIIDGNRFVECNEAAIRALGYASREELLNVHPSKLSPPRQPDGQDSYAKAESMLAIARDKDWHRCEWVYTKADGTDFVAEVTLLLIDPVDRQVIYCVWRDITERKRAEDAVRAQEEFFRMIAENVEDFLAVLDLEGRRLYNSPSYAKLFGSIDAIKGTDSFAEVHPDDVERVKQAFRETVRTGCSHRLDFRFVLADGSIHYMESCGALVRNSLGHPLRVVVVSRDITERVREEDAIRNLAFYDALTQLPNRRLLNDRLDQAMAASKRSGRYGALLFLDLDNFKPLNDMHGHSVGDLLLVEVARRITRCVRETDTASRFGGDEFVVVLTELHENETESAAQAEIVAQKINAALSEPYVLKAQMGGKEAAIIEHHCTSSIGVTLFINHEIGAQEIIKRSDMAMYQVKESGGNQVLFYDEKA